MSLHECGASTGAVSLAALLAGESASSADPETTVTQLAHEIAVGGWPGFRELPIERAQRGVRDYLEEIRRVDVARVGGTRRDPARVGALLRSLARNVATHAGRATLARDAGGADGALSDEATSAYLDALARLMVVEDQPAWAPHLRSSYVLRSAPKRHFADPSLAVAALRATPDRLLRDLRLHRRAMPTCSSTATAMATWSMQSSRRTTGDGPPSRYSWAPGRWRTRCTACGASSARSIRSAAADRPRSG